MTVGPIGRSASHFESPFSSSALAARCMFEEAMGGGNGVGMKVGHSRFLCSRQAKQQAYSNFDEWWETLTFDRRSVATCAPYLYVTPQPSLHTGMFTSYCTLSLFFLTFSKFCVPPCSGSVALVCSQFQKHDGFC